VLYGAIDLQQLTLPTLANSANNTIHVGGAKIAATTNGGSFVFDNPIKLVAGQSLQVV